MFGPCLNFQSGHCSNVLWLSFYVGNKHCNRKGVDGTTPGPQSHAAVFVAPTFGQCSVHDTLLPQLHHLLLPYHMPHVLAPRVSRISIFLVCSVSMFAPKKFPMSHRLQVILWMRSNINVN
ncbi:hypothetical protein KP509_12G063700 [Ceratopteris richardii]|uniref:Uncharacterized protein n=1 Tax=Ceratopteris richardii TaxID=49495 RepID=A0A8T2TJT3_CERRI|nr:hypothetical protein KP509_12G063700 [Ceratopteris richardii]